MNRREAFGTAGKIVIVGAGVGAGLVDPLEITDAIAAIPIQPSKKDEQGIRAHGLDYMVEEREGVKMHILRFIPGISDARFGVHWSDEKARASDVARCLPALAVVNGTFFDDKPLGSAASDRKVKYEAPEYIRELRRAVVYVRTDGTVGFDDFIVKTPASTQTMKAADILSQRDDIRDILGGAGWLVRDGEIVKGSLGEEAEKRVKRHALEEHHFSVDGGALGRSKRTVVATKGTEAYLIVTDSEVSLDRAAMAVKALGMDNAVFLDGGGSSEMILQGADGRHRRVDDAGEKERPMHTTIVLTAKPKVEDNLKATGK